MPTADRQQPPSRADQVAKLSDDYLLCRAVGHAYGPTEMGWGVKVGDAVQANWAWLRLVCQRCGMAVERVVDQHFGLVSSHYDQPEGYAITGQGRGHYRAEARRELLIRYSGPQPGRRRAGR